MAGVRCWSVWCCVFVVILRVIKTEVVQFSSLDTGRTPATEFSTHAVVRPRIFHGREKREISTTKEPGGDHIHDLTIGYDINGKDYILDLRLNRDLIPRSYFERYQHDGQHVVNRPTGKDLELCHYQGKLRGLQDSWAAISTCNGLSGVIYDGVELHYLEQGDTEGEAHFLYRHSDLTTNHSCGYEDQHSSLPDNHDFNRILRYKRGAEKIRGPYNANKQSRYVELVLVVDHKEYKELGESLNRVHQHCKEIANIINALYTPLNVFIALVGVVTWTEFDEITLSTNGDTTLTNFLHYRRERLVKEHPNDNAQLLTRVQFEGGVVGKALKGPICTYEFSGGVSMDHSNVVGLVATTVAHEMGHNFGMEHDTSECVCPSERCIMAPSSSSMSPTHWSMCSLEYLALAFEHGMDYCLSNKPERLFDSPVCGNGFVEIGEQCDCGLKDRCDNPCCNASSCLLHANASCATGECCDLETCRPHGAGSVCRSADHECDLPEYCTGQGEYCPDDVFKMDGESCDRGKAFCYQGSCRTHNDQCRLLWGPSGKTSDEQCYRMNTQGNRHGNCGYNKLNQSFIKCNDDNVYCGMLHCMHLNERLEFGMESVAILSHSFINTGGSIIPCRSAIVDLGLNQVDPGLVPDGARCGERKMCVNQKCMGVGSMRATRGVCPQDCNGNGVCNSRGNCHCTIGFAPPYCDYPGIGGSKDSGPASDPNARHEMVTALYVVFLGIVPLLTLMGLFLYYGRHRVDLCWWDKPRPSEAPPPQDSQMDKKPSAPPISHPDSVSLLPRQDNFFGQFKGFSLAPIPPVLPPANPLSTARPLISSPVLDATTCTAKELVASPSRAAPEVPSKQSKPPLEAQAPRQPEVAPVGYAALSNKPARPLSSPSPDPRPDTSYPTLTRLASFMMRQNAAAAAAGLKPGVKSSGQGKFPALDRLALRNLQISGPIQLQDVELPQTAVPIRQAPEPPKVVMRAQSLRDKVADRPAIHTFGSMRQPSGAKRPTSIPSGTRPSSPPPPRPPIVGLPGYQNPEPCYDDCLNLATEAPLAHIEEEDSPTNNIYAVIEESPEYKSPTRPGGSAESVGLLSEIVNEIQARNLDSIYGTSTLGRKKKSGATSDEDTESTATDAQFPDKSSAVASSNSSLGTYVNASNLYRPGGGYSNLTPRSQPPGSSSSSNSGYLSPTAFRGQDRKALSNVTQPSEAKKSLFGTQTASESKTPSFRGQLGLNRSLEEGKIPSPNTQSSEIKKMPFGAQTSTLEVKAPSYRADTVVSQPLEVKKNPIGTQPNLPEVKVPPPRPQLSRQMPFGMQPKTGQVSDVKKTIPFGAASQPVAGKTTSFGVQPVAIAPAEVRVMSTPVSKTTTFKPPPGADQPPEASNVFRSQSESKPSALRPQPSQDSEKLPTNLVGYKPYSSSLHRSQGPFASTFSSTKKPPERSDSKLTETPNPTTVVPLRGSSKLTETPNPTTVVPPRGDSKLTETLNPTTVVPPRGSSKLTETPKPASVPPQRSNSKLTEAPKPAIVIVQRSDSKLGEVSKSNKMAPQRSDSKLTEAPKPPTVVSQKSSGKPDTARNPPGRSTTSPVTSPISGRQSSKSPPRRAKITPARAVRPVPAIPVNNSPDIVSSCSVAKSPRSPDVLGSVAPTRAPKPPVLSRAATARSTNPPVPGKLAKSVSDAATVRASVPVRPGAAKLSHVASLQQKFEGSGANLVRTAPEVGKTSSFRK